MKFICKKCGSKEYKIDTQYNANGNIIRKLSCKNCGAFAKWITHAEMLSLTDTTSNLAWLKTLDAEEFAHQIFFRDVAQGRNFNAFVEWLRAAHTREDIL